MPAPSDEPVYVISVAARLADLPCWVLRVLDQEGIVRPSRTDSNRRLYSDLDLSVLVRVGQLTKSGVNMAGVKIILEMEQANPPAPTPPPPSQSNEIIRYPQKSLVTAVTAGTAVTASKGTNE